jgi:hypothetical protein
MNLYSMIEMFSMFENNLSERKMKMLEICRKMVDEI